MNFMLVTCRVLHVFSAVAWIGGLGFLGGVAGPVFKHFGARGEELALHVERRFVGFVWTAAWGLGISGVLLMMMDGRFLWFEFQSLWQFALLGKQILFIAMVASSLVISKSLKELVAPAVQPSATIEGLSTSEIIRWRVTILMRLNLVCGIVALLLAALM